MTVLATVVLVKLPRCVPCGSCSLDRCFWRLQSLQRKFWVSKCPSSFYQKLENVNLTSSRLKTIKIGHSSLHHMFMSNSPLQRVCFMAVGFWRSASWSCCCSWPSSWIAWPHGGRPTWGYGSHLGPPSWNRCWIKREKGIKKKVIRAP